MKKLFYILLVPLLLLSGSCEKFINEQPISELSTENFWNTTADAKLGMAGVYDGAQSVSQNFFEWGDARSDNVKFSGSGTGQISVSMSTLSGDLPAASWATIYTTISRANTAIKYMPKIQNMSETALKHNLAQLHAIRAWMYFYAIRVWGDVPLWLEPYENVAESPAKPRTPKAEIMQVILADLTKAESLVDPASIDLWTFNIGSIYCLQMEVAMWNHEYQKALDYYAKLDALKRYSLAPGASWNSLFTAPLTTKENIFTLHWDWVKDGGTRITALISSASGDASYVIERIAGEEDPITNRMRAQRQQGDIRPELTYDDEQAALGNGFKIGKFNVLNTPYPQNPQFVLQAAAEGNALVPVYRWAGIMLWRAEALNELNQGATALGIVNQIRARAGLTQPLLISNFPTKKAILTAILEESQIEQFAEGKRWWDLVRTGTVMEIIDPIIRKREKRANPLDPTLGFTDPRKILWPISRAAIQANYLLRGQQNPPWAEQ